MEPNRVDILMGITGVRFDTAWRNRVRGLYDDQRVYILGRQDLLRNKRRVGRPMDEIDALALKEAGRHRRQRRKK